MPKTKTGAHGENKTVQLKTLLTPTAKQLLQDKADQLGVSIGELVERFARGQLEEQAQIMGEY